MQDRLDCLLREIRTVPMTADSFTSAFRDLYDPLFTVYGNTAESMRRGDTVRIPIQSKRSGRVCLVTRSKDPIIRLIADLHQEFESFLTGIAFGPSGDDEDSFPARFAAFMDSPQTFPRYLLAVFEAVEKTKAHHATILPDSAGVDRLIASMTEALASEIADACHRLTAIRGPDAPVILRDGNERILRKTAAMRILDALPLRLDRAIGDLIPESHDGHFGGDEGTRSRIFLAPSRKKFLDPGSRFRVLAKHRSAFLIPTEAKQLASFVSRKKPKSRSRHGGIGIYGLGGHDEIRNHRQLLSGLEKIRWSLLPRLLERVRSIAPKEPPLGNIPSAPAEEDALCN